VALQRTGGSRIFGSIGRTSWGPTSLNPGPTEYPSR
jgi:hypothetical protein